MWQIGRERCGELPKSGEGSCATYSVSDSWHCSLSPLSRTTQSLEIWREIVKGGPLRTYQSAWISVNHAPLWSGFSSSDGLATGFFCLVVFLIRGSERVSQWNVWDSKWTHGNMIVHPLSSPQCTAIVLGVVSSARAFTKTYSPSVAREAPTVFTLIWQIDQPLWFLGCFQVSPSC